MFSKVMDNLHCRLIFDLDNKNEFSGRNLLKVVKFQNLIEKCCLMCEKYSLTKFANFLIVLSAEIVTAFGSKMVTISTRSTKLWKIWLRKAILSVYYRILRPNFGILLLLKDSFQEFRVFFRLDLPR